MRSQKRSKVCSSCRCDAPASRRWAYPQVADQTAKGLILGLVASWLDNDRLLLVGVPVLALVLAVLSTFVGDRGTASVLDQ